MTVRVVYAVRDMYVVKSCVRRKMCVVKSCVLEFVNTVNEV